MTKGKDIHLLVLYMIIENLSMRLMGSCPKEHLFNIVSDPRIKKPGIFTGG